MNVFIQLLGWLLLALTFIGSFRLSRYLARSDDAVLYPGLIASTVTAVFIIIVDVVILVTGVLAITLPTLWAVQRFTGYDPSIDLSMPDILARGTETEPDTDHGTHPNPESGGRPLLDVVGHLQNRYDHMVPDWLGQQSDEMEPIDIVELEDDDYWEDDD
ncbi:hypothetical protein [Natrinema salinisoli]|uniref:hypothetical protein n=1 Tax=Natrinema salinisoli TaxID=2878535 RepID=UPI001CF0332F|nr:hypothetical protein [Natrinema salinisoli]